MSVVDRLPGGEGERAALIGGACVLMAALFALTPLVVALPSALSRSPSCMRCTDSWYWD